VECVVVVKLSGFSQNICPIKDSHTTPISPITDATIVELMFSLHDDARSLVIRDL